MHETVEQFVWHMSDIRPVPVSFAIPATSIDRLLFRVMTTDKCPLAVCSDANVLPILYSSAELSWCGGDPW
jgi:hypothetical protein